MKRLTKKAAKNAPLCQHPVSIAYTPAPGLVDVEIEESTVETRVCQSKSSWVDPITGIHYCSLHKESKEKERDSEYSEYEQEPPETFPFGD